MGIEKQKGSCNRSFPSSAHHETDTNRKIDDLIKALKHGEESGISEKTLDDILRTAKSRT